MRETFTRSLRRALAEAQSQARTLKQDFVSTEHLLLGLLGAPACEASRLLQQNNVKVNELRSAVLRDMPEGKTEPVVTGDLPLSPKAQRVINAALVKAQSLREPKVSTRFVLMALVEDSGTTLQQALSRCGADLDELNRSLARKPAESEE